MRSQLMNSCARNVDANAERALDLLATVDTATDPLWETTRTNHILLRMAFANIYIYIYMSTTRKVSGSNQAYINI